MQNILRHFYSFPLPPFTFLLTSAILHPKVVRRGKEGRSKGEEKEKNQRSTVTQRVRNECLDVQVL